VKQLDAGQRRGFWHLCPDFVIEVKSESDRVLGLRDKMREYIENGAQLGWLIDPEKRTVEVYRPDGSFKTVTRAKKIEGEGPVAGFVLDLTYVWDPLAD
jgi:Uma2 family endonuclease